MRSDRPAVHENLPIIEVADSGDYQQVTVQVPWEYQRYIVSSTGITTDGEQYAVLSQRGVVAQIVDYAMPYPVSPFFEDQNGYAFSINDSGQAAGASGDCTVLQGGGTYLQARHALLWQTGGVTDLGTLGGTGLGMGILALGISNQGQVAGVSDLAGDEIFHGFLWSRDTGMEDLGTLPGDVASGALAVNDAGEVVGASFDKEFNLTAFVRQPGGAMTDLNTLIPANSPLFLVLACSINSSGYIAGVGITNAGEAHAFLATPVNAASDVIASEGSHRKRVPLSDAVRKQLQRRFLHSAK